MCARYTVFTEEELIEMRSIIDEISRKFGDGAVNTGEIRPTNMAPVLIYDGNRLSPSPVSRGFPKWDGKGVNSVAVAFVHCSFLDSAIFFLW